MCTVCQLSKMKNLKRKDAVLKLFSTSTVFAFSRCDWNLAPDRSTCLLFDFVFSPQLNIGADSASPQFVVVKGFNPGVISKVG